jgi:hypothetical protein
MIMTPKKKAIELINKYYSEISGMDLSYISKLIVLPNGDSHYETAKKCTLICVNEILLTLQLNHIQYGFYNNVKKELEKL